MTMLAVMPKQQMGGISDGWIESGAWMTGADNEDALKKKSDRVDWILIDIQLQ